MAKYNKEYKQNRKLKTGKKVLDGLTGTQYGPDGNPIMNSTTQQSSPFGQSPANYLGVDSNSGVYSTPDTQNVENQNDPSRYAGIATSAVVAGANYAKTYSDPNASTSDKAAAARQGVIQIAGSINPVVGGIIGGVDAIAQPIKTNLEKTDSQGNLENKRGAQAGAVIGNVLSPSTLATTIASGEWDLTGKKYTKGLEADAKAKIDAENAPAIEEAEMLRNQYYTFQNGGNLTRYETGGKHSDSPLGGIPIGPTSLVEEGETRGMENTASKDYIFSDTLKVPGKKYTYAKASKMIESRFSKRDNDKMSKEAMEREINSLMESQEGLRSKLIDGAYKKAFGGNIGDIKKNYPVYQEQNGKFYKGNVNVTPDEFRNINRNVQKLMWDSEVSQQEYEQMKGSGNVLMPYRTNEYLQNVNVPTFANGGNLGPVPEKDSLYIENKIARDPYLSAKYKYKVVEDKKKGDVLYRTMPNGKDIPVDFTNMRELDRMAYKVKMDRDLEASGQKPLYNVFAPPTYKCGGKLKHDGTGETSFLQDVERDRRGIPFETPGYYNNGFGVDNTNMINATNDLTQASAFGSNAVNNFDNTNKLDLTANTARGYVPSRFVAPYNPYKKSMQPFSLKKDDFTEMNMNPGSYPSVKSPGNNPVTNNNENAPRDSKFDPNTLYNAGNFMGGLYDIGRGARGGDEVNYERVSPDLVDYSKSREITRRDIKENFGNTQRELRNINNPGQYLSMLVQSAGQRDKNLADATAKSFEAEKTANTGLKNASKYFNAQVQKQEADARQMEKDVASNTLQAGMADFGEALAGTGRDKAATISQADAKRFIGSTEYSPITDKKGKIIGYRHKASNKTYKIG